MSDHYCCKRCHQRYDDCSCPATRISTMTEEDFRAMVGLNQADERDYLRFVWLHVAMDKELIEKINAEYEKQSLTKIDKEYK